MTPSTSTADTTRRRVEMIELLIETLRREQTTGLLCRETGHAIDCLSQAKGWLISRASRRMAEGRVGDEPESGPDA